MATSFYWSCHPTFKRIVLCGTLEAQKVCLVTNCTWEDTENMELHQDSIMEIHSNVLVVGHMILYHGEQEVLAALNIDKTGSQGLLLKGHLCRVQDERKWPLLVNSRADIGKGRGLEEKLGCSRSFPNKHRNKQTNRKNPPCPMIDNHVPYLPTTTIDTMPSPQHLQQTEILVS